MKLAALTLNMPFYRCQSFLFSNEDETALLNYVSAVLRGCRRRHSSLSSHNPTFDEAPHLMHDILYRTSVLMNEKLISHTHR